MAVELDESGILEEFGIEILGTKLDAIHKAEDRDLFRRLMNEFDEPVPDSDIIHNLEEAYDLLKNRLSGHRSPGIHTWRNRRRHLHNDEDWKKSLQAVLNIALRAVSA